MFIIRSKITNFWRDVEMWSSWNMLRWGTYKHSWYAASFKCAGIIRKGEKREIYGIIWALIFCILSKHDKWCYVCLVLKLITISVSRVPQWCLFLCVSTMLTAYFPIFTHFWLFVPVQVNGVKFQVQNVVFLTLELNSSLDFSVEIKFYPRFGLFFFSHLWQ